MHDHSIYIRLTGPCNAKGGYPWVEVVHIAGATWAPTENSGGNDPDGAGFDPAYELNRGRATNHDTAKFEARRSPDSGLLLFR